MGKMIDEDLIKDFKSKIKDYDKDYAFSQEEVLNILERYEIKYAKSTIEAIPKDQYEQRLKADLANMQPVIHARWLSHIEHCKKNNLIPSGLGSYVWCSECGCGIESTQFHRVEYNYCPKCGAKMD